MKTMEITQRVGTTMRWKGWTTAITTLILGCVALLMLIQTPEALLMAAGVGACAVTIRVGYNMLKTERSTEGEKAVANTGLVIAAVALAPLILFALLWTSLLLIIGGAWLLHLVGLA